MINRRQRSAIADALLGAGATVLLLYSTSNVRGGRIALVAGILLVLAGAALLWGTPQPDLRTRMLASVSGLFLGFGVAVGGPGMWLSVGVGGFLMAALLLQLRTRR